MKKLIFLISIFLSSFLYSDKKSDLLTYVMGINNVLREKNRSEEFRCEYKSHLEWYRFRPFVGFSITTKEQLFLYQGISLEIIEKEPISLAISFAPGYYYKGNGKDLGFPLEFRSAIEVAILKKSSRVGVNFSHTSNASLGRKNPGLEALVFFVSIAIKEYN